MTSQPSIDILSCHFSIFTFFISDTGEGSHFTLVAPPSRPDRHFPNCGRRNDHITTAARHPSGAGHGHSGLSSLADLLSIFYHTTLMPANNKNSLNNNTQPHQSRGLSFRSRSRQFPLFICYNASFDLVACLWHRPFPGLGTTRLCFGEGPRREPWLRRGRKMSYA